MPVHNDGSVLRETLLSQLESTDFCFRRIHFELAAEVKGSLASLATHYSPELLTVNECFFQHSRGEYFEFIKVLL